MGQSGLGARDERRRNHRYEKANRPLAPHRLPFGASVR